MFTMFLLGFIACSDDDTESTDTSSQGIDENQIQEDSLDTMEEYISSYCSVYSMRCGGVYASQEECEIDVLDMWGDKVCYVTDTSLLQVCIDWLADFPCDEVGWDSSCDEFYICE